MEKKDVAVRKTNEDHGICLLASFTVLITARLVQGRYRLRRVLTVRFPVTFCEYYNPNNYCTLITSAVHLKARYNSMISSNILKSNYCYSNHYCTYSKCGNLKVRSNGMISNNLL